MNVFEASETRVLTIDSLRKTCFSPSLFLSPLLVKLQKNYYT